MRIVSLVTDTSNWMRFVQMATNNEEQNLLLHELDSKLYFKSCQFIRPKQQLKVGYSKEYAEKYNLNQQSPDKRERQELLTIDHNNVTVFRGKHRLDTGALRKQKSKTSGPIVRYACCYCSKVFSKFSTYKKHTIVVHSVDVENKKHTAKEEKQVCGKPRKWFVCCLCQRYFSSAEKLEVDFASFLVNPLFSIFVTIIET